MKIIHVSIIIGIVFSLAFNNPASAHRIYPTPEEFYKESDLIVLGKILSYDYDKSDIRYQIEVKEYVKKPASFDGSKRIEVFGCNPTPPSGFGVIGGGCQTFERGQNVFFGLEEKPYKKFFISDGFIVENPNCTGKQLVQAISPTSGIGVYQNQKPSPLFVGKNIDIVYDFVNNDLFAKNITVQFSDIPFTTLGLDHDQVLAVEINDEELNKIPNAQRYYERIIREKIPFNVPIKVTFGKYWKLGDS